MSLVLNNRTRIASKKEQSYLGLHCLLRTICPTTQSGPQDQKSVTFSHSVISLNQLLQNSINTAYIFLTFRNHVKMFLSQDILHNVSNEVYFKTLSIRTDRTDKTVKTLIRLLLEEQSDQGLHCLSFYPLHLHIILQRKPKLFNFRIFSILI